MHRKYPSRFFRNLQNLVELRRIHADGLFANDILARPHRGYTVFFMEVIRRSDQDDIRFFAGIRVLGRRKTFQAAFFNDFGSFGTNIVRPDDFDFGDSVPYVFIMPFALISEADNDQSMFHKFHPLQLDFRFFLRRAI